MLRPLQRAGLVNVPGLDDVIMQMSGALGLYLLPDGSLAHFNDSTDGVAPPPQTLMAEAGCASAPADAKGGALFAPAGLFVYSGGKYHCVVVCAGPSPPANPAHAHAAAGSFILHWGGRPLIVDPGCSTYAAGEMRNYERGTRSHNTITVDGHDQSEMWGRYRIARRAKVSRQSFVDASGLRHLIVTHDGYRRLPGRVTHRRHFVFGEEFLIIADRLTGRGDHRIEMLLTFAPGVEAARSGAKWLLQNQGEPAALFLAGPTAAQPVSARVARGFGASCETHGLQLSARAELPWWGLAIIGPPSLDVALPDAGGNVAVEGQTFNFAGSETPGRAT